MGQKVKIIQSVFNRGELSPRLRGRVDNDAYYKAYDEGENFLPFAEGSGTFRPGSVYTAEVKDSTKTTIIYGFQFSTVQNYIIEFGDQYVRFYRNRGQVETGPSTPYEVSTPYLEADLRELYFFQSADVLYIFHQSYQPRKLIRSSDTSWALETVDFQDGPYQSINTSATTFALASGVTLTASAATFEATDVGRTFRIKDGSAWLFGTIDTFNSSTSVTVTTYDEINGAAVTNTVSATKDWRLSAFGGGQNWPAVGTIFEERLVCANTAALPSTIWMGITGDFEVFSPSDLSDGAVAVDSGIAFTIADDQVNDINWLSSGRVLLVGTTGAEHSLTGGTSSGFAPVTPSNVTVKREATFGSKQFLRAHRVGNAVIYSSQSGRKMREIYYEFGIDSYVSRDVTIFNEQVTRSGIVDSTYLQEPDPYLWTCTENGELVGFLYERTQEVEGWHRHILGGTDAVVESVASIPRPGDENDDLWMVVRRTVNGSTVRYIEYLSEIWEDVEAPISGVSKRLYAKYLDSCITYDGYYSAGITLGATTGTGITVTADASVFSSSDVGKQLQAGTSKATVASYVSATEITVDITADFTGATFAAGNWCMAAKDFTGADHLEAETIQIVADGAVVDDVTVSSGAFSLSDFACVVHAGFNYSLRVKMLLPEVPSLGTIQGRERSISRLHIYVTDTYGMSINDSITDITDTVKFLKFPVNFNEAPALRTGLISLHPPSGYEKDSQVTINHTTPTPFTLNYVVQDLDVND